MSKVVVQRKHLKMSKHLLFVALFLAQAPHGFRTLKKRKNKNIHLTNFEGSLGG
jgi:hypothetical protein